MFQCILHTLRHPAFLAYFTQTYAVFLENLTKMGSRDYFDFRSSLDRFYKLERTQYCKGYSYVAFGCFCFTFFLFLIKISKYLRSFCFKDWQLSVFPVDCTEENCFESYKYEEGMSWTLQSMTAIGTISAVCFILGFILIKVAKHREKFRGYQEIWEKEKTALKESLDCHVKVEIRDHWSVW